MERWGVRDTFQDAVDGENCEGAARILTTVGADERTAWEMVAVLMLTETGETR
jgi:hypothetical protein